METAKGAGNQDANSIPGWDSELTELSPSDEETDGDESESEVDPDKVSLNRLARYRLYLNLYIIIETCQIRFQNPHPSCY